MRIVHLNTLDHGGAGLAALRLHLGLLREGAASTLVVLNKLGEAPGVVEAPLRESPDGAAAWRALLGSWRGRLLEYMGRPPGRELFSGWESEAALEACEALREADVVHLHWIAGLLDLGSMRELLRGKAVVWTLHDQNPFTGGCHYADACGRFSDACGCCPELGSEAAGDLSAAQWAVKRDAYAGLRMHVVSPSRWLAGEARRSALMGGCEVSVIPNGVPLDLFRPSDGRGLRAEHGLRPDDFLVLHGAHTQRKGFASIDNLLSRLPASLGGRRVVAASVGLAKQPLSGRPAVPCVDFGKVDGQERMAAIYGAADVFVLPTLMDNLPNTVLECLACGRPVVASRVGGLPDCLRHGENGWMCAPGDVEGLLQGLAAVAEGAMAPRERIAADAARRFSQRRQARACLRLYHRLVAGRG